MLRLDFAAGLRPDDSLSLKPGQRGAGRIIRPASLAATRGIKSEDRASSRGMVHYFRKRTCGEMRDSLRPNPSARGRRMAASARPPSASRAGEPHRRRSGPSTPLGVPDDDQQVLGVDRGADRRDDFLDGAAPLGADHGFHLHRLYRHQHVALIDRVALTEEHLWSPCPASARRRGRGRLPRPWAAP